MFAYWNSPFGMIDVYILLISVGVAASLLTQGVLILAREKKVKYLLYFISYGIVMYCGQYFASLIRGINGGRLAAKKSFLYSIIRLEGTHYLGYVIAFYILLLPLMWFVRELLNEFLHFEISDKKERIRIAELFMAGLPIQHIFNRLACLCRGCCYGIRYDGIGSVLLPCNPNIDYRVFPSQLLEVFCMLLLTVIVCCFLKRQKSVWGLILIGFAVTFFISEFFMDDASAVRHYGMTYIQFISIALIPIGVIYGRYIKKAQECTAHDE